MILQVANWYLGYGQILEDCRTSEGRALVLCHADVDAIAAARILTYMMRADQVEYVLQVCNTADRMRQLASGTAYAAIVLLNVGGTSNLTRLFGAGQDKLSLRQTKVYLLDPRRPIHLANLHAENHIVVFWDPTHGSLEDLPSDGDNLSANDDSSDSDEDESGTEAEDEVEENDDDNQEDGEEEMEFEKDESVAAESKNENQQKDEEEDKDDYDGEDEQDPLDDESDTDDRITPEKKKRRLVKVRDTGNETDATEALDDDDPETPLPATATTAASTPHVPPMTPAEVHQQRQTRLRLYYSYGSSYGTPAAFVTYQLACQLRFGSLPDLLWLCMIGVTDAFLQSRLDVVGYAMIADTLTDNCLKIFPTVNALERAENTVYAEELLVGRGAATQAQTKLTFSERGRILPQTDFRFFLLRHSSLLDAMQCSPYVSTQMQLWTKPGMQKLHELLARMGYPLTDCMQPYHFLKPSLKRQLPARLAMNKDEYNLEELEFTSFVRVTGFSSLTSASDVSYAASALLECPAIQSDSGDDAQSQEDRDLVGFQGAFDVLGNHTSSSTSSKGQASFQTGIQWAAKLQRLILANAIRLVKTNAITRLRHFRYAYITTTVTNPGEKDRIAGNPQDKKDADYHVLAKPLALTRLANYLMDMHRADGKWTGDKKRPLVLLAEQPANSTYLVAGYEMTDNSGHLERNKLGQYFALVAESMKSPEDGQAVARLESFDAHVLEVASTHAQRFLEQLHYIMDSV